MLVAGSAQLVGRDACASRRHPRRSSRATTSARTPSFPRRLGFIPRRSVVEAVSDMLGGDRHRATAPSSPTRATTTSAGSSSSTRSSRASRSSARSCEPRPRADHRRRRAARVGPGGAAAAAARRWSRATARPSTSPTTRRWRAAFERCPSRRGLQLRGVPQRGGVRARGGPLLRGQRPRGQAAGGALRRERREARPPEHQLRLRRHRAGPVPGGRAAVPAQHLRALQAGRRVRGARVRARARIVARGGRSLRPARQRVEGRQLRHAHGRARPRAGRSSRWWPTSA